jgi:hypothetical protein
MDEEDLARLLDKLDLRQKARLLTGATTWRTAAEPAVALGAMTMSDGPAGVRGEAWDERETSALLPSATGMPGPGGPRGDALVDAPAEAIPDGRAVARRGAAVRRSPSRTCVGTLRGATMQTAAAHMKPEQMRSGAGPRLSVVVGILGGHGTQEDPAPMTDKQQGPTPAELRELMSEVHAVQRRVQDTYLRLWSAPETRDVAYQLEDAAGDIRRAWEALERIAGSSARVHVVPGTESLCGVPWGVCPDHGNTLRSSGDNSWCTAADCLRKWGHDKLGTTCGEPVAHKVTDAGGKSFLACRAHAMDAEKRF